MALPSQLVLSVDGVSLLLLNIDLLDLCLQNTDLQWVKVNYIKTVILKFIGQGAISSFILQIQGKSLAKTWYLLWW